MSHHSNCCLLDDLGRSMNRNKIHIIPSVFGVIDWPSPALDFAWPVKAKEKNPPVLAGAFLQKYWRGFQILWSRSLVLLVACPNSCLFSRGWKQSEWSSNLSFLYLGNDNLAPLRLCAMKGDFVVFLQYFTSSLIPVLWPIISEPFLFVCAIFLRFTARSPPPSLSPQ